MVKIANVAKDILIYQVTNVLTVASIVNNVGNKIKIVLNVIEIKP